MWLRWAKRKQNAIGISLECWTNLFTNTFMYFCITCFRTSALKYTLTSAVSNYFSTIPIIEQNKFKIALLTDVNYTSWKKRPINTYGCRQIIRIKEIWITTKHKVNVVYFLNINTFKVSSRALQKVPWSCDCPLNVSTPDSRSESSNPTTLS